MKNQTSWVEVAGFFFARAQVVALVFALWSFCWQAWTPWQNAVIGVGLLISLALIIDMTRMYARDEAERKARHKARMEELDAEIQEIQLETEKLRAENKRLAELEAKLDALWEKEN